MRVGLAPDENLAPDESLAPDKNLAFAVRGYIAIESPRDFAGAFSLPPARVFSLLLARALPSLLARVFSFRSPQLSSGRLLAPVAVPPLLPSLASVVPVRYPLSRPPSAVRCPVRRPLSLLLPSTVRYPLSAVPRCRRPLSSPSPSTVRCLPLPPSAVHRRRSRVFPGAAPSLP